MSLQLTKIDISDAIIGLTSIIIYEDGSSSKGEEHLSFLIETFSVLNKKKKQGLEDIRSEISKLYTYNATTTCFYTEVDSYIKQFSNKILNFNDLELNMKIIQNLKILVENKSCKELAFLYIGQTLKFSLEYLNDLLGKANYKNKDSHNHDKNKKTESTFNDPYEILHCSRSDTDEYIKKKYREIVKKFHPDVIYGKDLDEEFIRFAEAKFKEINRAYEEIKEERGIK